MQNKPFLALICCVLDAKDLNDALKRMAIHLIRSGDSDIVRAGSLIVMEESKTSYKLLIDTIVTCYKSLDTDLRGIVMTELMRVDIVDEMKQQIKDQNGQKTG